MAKLWKKLRDKRHARETGNVLPPPRTDGDPDFDTLPLAVRTEINNALDWMLELEQAGAAHLQAKVIAERYTGTDTEGKKRPGLSGVSIYRRFLVWKKAGRDWRSLEKYKSLRKGEAQPLQAYNLTPEAVHNYFKRQGMTLAQWAAKHGFNADSVSDAINARRTTAMSQKILDTLAGDMRGEPQGWQRTIETLQREAAALRSQAVAFEQRLASWKKRLPPWM